MFEVNTWEFYAIIKLAIAAIFGGIIGFNREFSAENHGGAGLRTFTLVSMGATLFTIIALQGIDSSLGDPLRIIAHIVTGIGFIGAGVIWQGKKQLQGLSTAAGIWITAAIGMCIGAGLYIIATSTLILTIIALEIKEYIVKKGKRR